MAEQRESHRQGPLAWLMLGPILHIDIKRITMDQAIRTFTKAAYGMELDYQHA